MEQTLKNLKCVAIKKLYRNLKNKIKKVKNDAFKKMVHFFH